MARLNFEDSIFKEHGFQDLLIAVGNRHIAKGMVIELFGLAQEYWFPEKQLIPIERFKSAGLSEALYGPSGLAELRGNEIYVRGSREAFAWLFDKQSAGKASAEAKKKKKRPTLQIVEPVSTAVNSRQQPLTDVDECQQPSTSLLFSPSLSSFSSSFSSSVSNSFSNTGERAEKIPAPPHENLVKVYCDLWKERYRASKSPPIGGKVAGQFKTLVKDYGPRRAEELVRAYLAMPDQWFMTKRHDITTLLANLNAVAQFADNGKLISKTELRQADESAALSAQLRRIETGEL